MWENPFFLPRLKMCTQQIFTMLVLLLTLERVFMNRIQQQQKDDKSKQINVAIERISY